ncbi:uncharacterized protein At3g28850-like [Impatiens glandulifera]|uniref:uncharacterized protein At3g28850-like n=1 Tax=Impatiens glandulifera TaxID=253017 RepID=UPI001FB04DC4|nr:uncharacterized protein At3g28850-like [Impatiens glandulifera]
MKGVLKGMLLKKLKKVRAIGYLKPERFLTVNASDRFIFSRDPEPKTEIKSPQKEEYENQISVVGALENEIIDVSELMRDLEDDESDFSDEIDDKENTKPDSDQTQSLENSRLIRSVDREFKPIPLSEMDISDFRRPEFESNSLFDPNLLSAFHQAVSEIKSHEAEEITKYKEKIQESYIEIEEEESEEEEERPQKTRKIEEEENEGIQDPLLDFEEKCPPGGSCSVILYTTGLRGILKTFEDCASVRCLLQHFKVLFFERDISMHAEFRDELWETLGEKLLPPRLFIMGRLIGGAEEVLSLHEQGRLRPLFHGLPEDRFEGPCDGCGGIRFVICYNCNGSNKVVAGNDGSPEECPECNENGLNICPYCC